MSTVASKAGLVALTATVFLCTTSPAQVMRCPASGCPGSGPGSGPTRPDPPTYVSLPDMAVQFSTCLSDLSSAIPAFVLANVRDTLVGAMQDLDINHDDPPPNPDVRHACINGKSTFGGWLQPVGSYGSADTATGRNVGLSQLNLLVADESVAFNFRPAAISRLVQIRWRDQPRRLNDDGEADPGGSVHLTGYELHYRDGDYYDRRIVDLALDGWYDYIQDTDITLHIFDFLKLAPYGQLECETYSEAEPTETTIDTILATFVGGAGGSLGDVVSAGPGCQIANRLPRTVLVPQTAAKVNFAYSRVNALPSSGLSFGGTWEVVARQTWASVQGPIRILAEPGQLFSDTFKAVPHDMRRPITVVWTSQSATPVSGPTTAIISWNLPTLAVGAEAQRMLRATVTDADGITATAYKAVMLKRVTDAEPLPPMCDEKPWMPDCQ